MGVYGSPEMHPNLNNKQDDNKGISKKSGIIAGVFWCILILAIIANAIVKVYIETFVYETPEFFIEANTNRAGYLFGITLALAIAVLPRIFITVFLFLNKRPRLFIIPFGMFFIVNIIQGQILSVLLISLLIMYFWHSTSEKFTKQKKVSFFVCCLITELIVFIYHLKIKTYILPIIILYIISYASLLAYVYAFNNEKNHTTAKESRISMMSQKNGILKNFDKYSNKQMISYGAICIGLAIVFFLFGALSNEALLGVFSGGIFIIVAVYLLIILAFRIDKSSTQTDISSDDLNNLLDIYSSTKTVKEEVEELLKKADSYINLANKTTSVREFMGYYDKMLEILKETTSYEKNMKFITTPTDEYNRLLSEKQKHIQDALKREFFNIIEQTHDDDSYIKLYYENFCNEVSIIKDQCSPETLEVAEKYKNELSKKCQPDSHAMPYSNAINKVLSFEDLIKYEMLDIDLMSTDGWQFEKYCAELLLSNGFVKAETTQKSNDYGVDIIAENTDGVKYAIQCKCYSNKLGNTPVQEIVAGMKVYNCQVGVVLTNNYFTNNAHTLAQNNGILLWDRDRLQQMIVNKKKQDLENN